jgi:zinc transport system permease protein
MSFLNLPFMRTAFLVSVLAGNALGMIGLFVLLRRIAFAGLAATQLAALGAVVGVLLGHFGSFGFAVLLVGVGLVFISKTTRIRRVPPEAWVACLYVLGASLAVLILSKAPRGESETMTVFFGNVLSLGPTEVIEAAVVAFLVFTPLLIWTHRLIWMSFDPMAVDVAGFSLGRWTFLFFAVFTYVMTVTIHLFGVLLAFAYLILPAVGALLLTRRVRSLLIVIPAATTAIITTGFELSFRWDFPTGPFIAAVLAGFVLVAGLFRLVKR